MANAVSVNICLPCARALRKMTRKDTLYNDFRDYLREQGVGFPHDLASTLGENFLSNLSEIIFTLSSKVWRALNDKHNRGVAAPEQEFTVFFGKRVYSKKADRPNYSDSCIRAPSRGVDWYTCRSKKEELASRYIEA